MNELFKEDSDIALDLIHQSLTRSKPKDSWDLLYETYKEKIANYHSAKNLKEINRIIKTKYDYIVELYRNNEITKIDDLFAKYNLDEEILSALRNIIIYCVEKSLSDYNFYNNASLVEVYLRDIEEICYSQEEYILSLLTNEKNINLKNLYEYIIELSKLYAYLKYPNEGKLSHIILGDFALLISSLKKCGNLSNEDKISIFFLIIKQNIDNGILDDNLIGKPIDEDAYNEANIILNSLSSDENIFPNIYSLKFKEQYMQPNKKEGFVIGNKIGLTELKNINNIHRIINDHYFNKIDTYNKDDIQIIKKALYNIRFPKLFIDNVERKLTKDFIKRENSRRVISETVIPKREKISFIVDTKPLINKKVYHQIYNELLTFYDFDKNESFRYLKLDEIIYCICLLNKLGFNELSISDFITRTIRFNKTCNNSNDLIRENIVSKRINSFNNPKTVDTLKEIENDTKEIFELLTKEEYINISMIISSINLLRKLNIPEIVINEFIEYINNKNKLYRINPITRYLELYDKLEYYQDNEEIKELLNELNHVFNNIFITSNEDYEFYKEYLEDGINNLLTKVNNEYEFVMSKK